MKNVELIGVESKEDLKIVYEALENYIPYLPDLDGYEELIKETEKDVKAYDKAIKKIDRKLGLIGNTNITAMGMGFAAAYNMACFVIHQDEFFNHVIPMNLGLLAAFTIKEVYDHNTKDAKSNILYVDKEKLTEERRLVSQKLKKLKRSKLYNDGLTELKESLSCAIKK